MRLNKPLKTIFEVPNAVLKQAKKQGLLLQMSIFSLFNAAMATPIVFQQPAKYRYYYRFNIYRKKISAAETVTALVCIILVVSQ